MTQQTQVYINALFCYICGGGFGTKSLPIHLAKCPKRWTHEQGKLPLKLQVKVPPPPAVAMPTSLKDQQLCKDWNDEAFAIAQDSRDRCVYCNRRFGYDKIVKHLEICRKKTDAIPDPLAEGSTAPSATQSFFMCPICARDFGSTSITIHLPQCHKQFHEEQQKLPEEQRKTEPDLDAMLGVIEKIKSQGVNTEEIIKQRKEALEAYKSGLVKCPACGKSFEASRLAAHKKGCATIQSVSMLGKGQLAPVAAAPADVVEEDNGSGEALFPPEAVFGEEEDDPAEQISSAVLVSMKEINKGDSSSSGSKPKTAGKGKRTPSPKPTSASSPKPASASSPKPSSTGNKKSPSPQPAPSSPKTQRPTSPKSPSPKKK